MGAVPAPFLLGGAAWLVSGWTAAVSRWPDEQQWSGLVETWLHDLNDQGAVVAWLGYEGAPYVDPPDLFDPAWMSGAVLSARTADGHCMQRFHPDRPLATLSDDELQVVRDRTRGCSDAR